MYEFQKILLYSFNNSFIKWLYPIRKNYQFWVDSATNSQEPVDSSIERLTKAKID